MSFQVTGLLKGMSPYYQNYYLPFNFIIANMVEGGSAYEWYNAVKVIQFYWLTKSI